MTTTTSLAAGDQASLGATIAVQLAHAQDLTRAASLALGLDEQAAEQAAADGGVVIDGALVTVAPLPLGAAEEPLPGGMLMVSVETGQHLQDLDAQDASALFANAPGLLAVFDAAIGCHPDGSIVLHRAMRAATTGASDLAHCMLATRQLAQLLGGGARVAEGQ